jgi:hypothetical protein
MARLGRESIENLPRIFLRNFENTHPRSPLLWMRNTGPAAGGTF